MVTRSLAETGPRVDYYGLLRPDQKDVVPLLESMVYKHWDSSSHAPAKQRPASTAATPQLQLSVLSCQNGMPGFPDELLRKFPQDSAEHAVMLQKKKEFEALVPESARATTQPSTSTGPANRARGSPDFSIDGGKKPLDFQRVIDLPAIPNAEFTEERLVF